LDVDFRKGIGGSTTKKKGQRGSGDPRKKERSKNAPEETKRRVGWVEDGVGSRGNFKLKKQYQGYEHQTQEKRTRLSRRGGGRRTGDRHVAGQGFGNNRKGIWENSDGREGVS